MGLFDKIRGEFIDIIEWRDQQPGVLVHRFERHEHEIKMGAQLTVRPGQRAVFVNEGKIADVFEEGLYTLETANMPILTTLKGWKYGFNSPFKAEVYFLNITEQLDRKWGTGSPIIVRDADFGMVRLRARGNYSYKMSADKEMISRLVGARQAYTTDDIEGQLRAKAVSSFSDAMGELKVPILDLQAQYDEIGDAMKTKLASMFDGLGLELLGFILENVTVPEEVEKAMDQRASMGAVGNMNQFSQYQAAQALRDAADNPGMAGNMMGMMVGGQLASGMGDVLKQDNPTAQPAAAGVTCPKCSAVVAAGAKFCGGCGTSMIPEGAKCIKCGAALAAGAKFCGECGAPQQVKCVKCGADLAPGSKFCGECGAAQGEQ
ncbi:MAG: SPFH domain-containing protein [Kiritimatiellae bacterium]|jgi:membrane protease subunit (stomatin/prohibitin family)|nr:SPFH domain-containing protein [Kiritimatiellia bacterium]